MPNIKKTKYGTWETYLYLGVDENGKKVKKHISAKTKPKLMAEIDRATGIFNAHNVNEMNMTVMECVNEYIDRKRANASPKTIKEYENYRKNFPELHSIRLKDLTDMRIQIAIDRAARDHSPKTIQNWWGLFHASITYYYRTFNPRLEMPKKARPKFEMPEVENLYAMLGDIRGSHMEVPVLLACFCGLRRGEISCLDLDDDIHYEYNNKGFVRVTKDMVQCPDNSWIVKEPKTPTAIRNVPIPDVVLERIEACRDDPKYHLPTPNSISKNWQRMRKKYGIGCSFHGLRHYFASLMAAEGIPMKYQRDMLGHTTDSMTMRYQEHLKEKGVEINEKLAERINNIFDKKDSAEKLKNHYE